MALCAPTFWCAPSASAVTIDEFPLGATPTGIATGPDGDLYVTTTTSSILRVSPSGTVTARYPLTQSGSPVAGEPTFSGGALWFTLTRTDGTHTLGRRAPDGTIVEFPIAAQLLATAPGGDVWAASGSSVTRIAPGGQAGASAPLPQTPSSLASDPSGQLWATLSTTGTNVIQVSPSGAATSTSIPETPRKVAASLGSSAMWFLSRDHVFGIENRSDDFVFWLPQGSTGTKIGSGFLINSNPQNIAAGPDGNAWLTDAVEGSNPSFGPPGAIRIGRVSALGRVTSFTAGLAGDASLEAIVAGPGDTMWFTDGAGRIGRVTLDRPSTTTEPTTDVGQTGASVGAVTTPNGTASRVRFVYGTTTDYDQTTRWQDVGDGDAGVRRSARLEGLPAGTTYHYRAEVLSPFGTASGPDRTFTTVPIPPPPPIPPADADGDGYAVSVDCDDKSPNTYPGAVDMPGDGVDQDCSGADEPLPRFFPHVEADFHNERRWSRLKAFVVDDLPAGATVELRCSGRGCRFDHWRKTVRHATDELDLLAQTERSKLSRGAILELRLTLAETIGTVIRWKVGPPPKPTVTCLRPGAKKDRKC